MMALKQWLKTAEIRRTPFYAIYQIKTRDCVITTYEFGKLIFQGSGAEERVVLIAPSVIQKTQSGTTVKKAQGQLRAIYPQAGSNEIRAGDHFDPVTVYATCVRHEDAEFLRSLEIQDSKVVDDTAIRRMAPELMEQLPHNPLTLNNVTYNRIHSENNMVAIKPRMHNQAYIHPRKETGSPPQFRITDQFMQKISYYHYLKHKHEVVYDIHFEIKAENKYPSVVAGSTVARYASLEAFDAMCGQYDLTFLKSAGNRIDQSIRELMAMHGRGILPRATKLHFANTKKALG